jgi:hypothetical protein
MRLYLKDNLKPTELVAWFKWRSARSCVEAPLYPKKEKVIHANNGL